MLSQAPIWVHPQPEGEFILDTDTSNEGIGAVLLQVQNGQEKVIAYGSKMLSKTEGNYCITRHELLAMVHLVTQFKHFLEGRHFLVRTDKDPCGLLRPPRDRQPGGWSDWPHLILISSIGQDDSIIMRMEVCIM